MIQLKYDEEIMVTPDWEKFYAITAYNLGWGVQIGIKLYYDALTSAGPWPAQIAEAIWVGKRVTVKTPSGKSRRVYLGKSRVVTV